MPSLAPIECGGADLSKLSGTRVRAERSYLRMAKKYIENVEKFNSLSLGSQHMRI